MKNNQILLLIDNDDLIKKAKKVGINTFLFPVRGYSVGLKNTYELEDIKEEAFLYINRNLTNEDIDNLKTILTNLPTNIKGIVFEDLGLINVLKDTNLVKIYDSRHLNCSYLSVNAILDFVDSVILSTDVTEPEMEVIIENASKKISLYTFGLNLIMYSRRTLLTNYAKEYNLDKKEEKDVLEKVTNQKFKVVENEYGTVFYPEKFYDGLRLFNYGAAYYVVNMAYLGEEDQDKLLINFENGNYSVEGINANTSSYFLDEETYYKLPPKEDGR